jgi:hypothetical protein
MLDTSQAFDLGVTAATRGDAPSAVAHFLEARELSPRDAEIADALAAARETSGSQVHAQAPWPIAATELALVLVLVNLGASVAAAMRASRRALYAAGACWLLVAALWITRVATRPEYAVASRENVITHVADDATSMERYRLHAGDEVLVKGHRGEWLKIQGPEGAAYVAEADVVLLGR